MRYSVSACMANCDSKNKHATMNNPRMVDRLWSCLVLKVAPFLSQQRPYFPHSSLSRAIHASCAFPGKIRVHPCPSVVKIPLPRWACVEPLLMEHYTAQLAERFL